MSIFKSKKSYLLALSIVATQAFGYQLITGAGIVGGNIPGNNQDIDVSLFDGAWVPSLTLSPRPLDGSWVKIRSTAGWDSAVKGVKTNVPVPSFLLSKGDVYNFKWDKVSQIWKIQFPNEKTPATGGTVLPHQNASMVQYATYTNDWSSSVTLPPSARNGAVIVVAPQTGNALQIQPKYVEFAYTMKPKAGDRFGFTFDSTSGKWKLNSSPAQITTSSNLNGKQIPGLTAPVQQLTLDPNAFMLGLILPPSAGDRDRLRIKSNAVGASSISNVGADFQGSMGLAAQEEYEFTWMREKNQWAMTASPEDYIYVRSIKQSGQLPNTRVPLMRVFASDDGLQPSNWRSAIYLPNIAKVGDKVKVSSNTLSPMSIYSNRGDFGVTPFVLTDGNVRVFVYTATGWK
jgi:hypothetical protein